MRDTIFALATAPGRGAVAVTRVSGPRAGACVERLCGARPKPRQASLRRLKAGDGSVIDEAVVLWLPGPASFTGEDCAEFQTHGGGAVVQALAEALIDLGARPAEPGAFTRRAFEAGRLDLTQAEAIADLVDAETQAQRRQAVAQLSGALSARYVAWRDWMLDALAFVEAGIDFPEEEDVPGGVADRAGPLIATVREEIRIELGSDRGERVREGLRIAIVGSPNVGKSSLLNTLAGRDAAIVTEIPGTTRDVVEVSLVIAGQMVTLADTAGLRDTDDRIEREGVRRARAWADDADIRLHVGDLTRVETFANLPVHDPPGDIVILNKADIAPLRREVAGVVASATASGVSDLRAMLEAAVSARVSGRDFPAITRARHREALMGAIRHLERAEVANRTGAELAGADIRLALREFERVTGAQDPEAVLDRVFSTFCIGK